MSDKDKSTPPEAPKPKMIAGKLVTSVADQAEPSSILVYGPPKLGKSTLTGSLSVIPGYERGLVLMVEKSGSIPLSRKFPTVEEVVFDDHDVDGVIAVINELRYGKAGDDYDWVCLDTMSTFQKWALDDDVMKHPGKIKGKPEFEHWQTLLDLMMDTMWDLHYMKPMGIALYHEKTEQNELTKDLVTGPMIQGSARHSVASVPDMVLNLRVNSSGVRTLKTTPKKGMAAGNRFEDVINEDITGNDKVNMTTLFNLLRA